MKAREARRNQAQTVIKEMKLRPKIDPHDYETKKGHVVRFLKAGDKVKITIMFRGREQSRPELGFRLLQRLADDVAGAGVRRVQPEAGRPQHADGAGPAPRRSPRRWPRRRASGRGPHRRGKHDGECTTASSTSRRTDRVRDRPKPDTARRGLSAPHPHATHDDDSRGDTATMPKVKTHSGASKRFKITGTGKSCASRPTAGTCWSTSPRARTRRLASDAEMCSRRRQADQEAARSSARPSDQLQTRPIDLGPPVHR